MSWINLAEDIRDEFDQRIGERIDLLLAQRKASAAKNRSEWCKLPWVAKKRLARRKRRYWANHDQALANARARYARDCQRSERIVTCPCGTRFSLTTNRKHQGVTHCSRGCPAKARGRVLLGRPIGMWAKHTGLKVATIDMRLRRGWDVERALTTPVQTRGI